MKRSIFLTPTSTAIHAARSKKFPSSIAKTRRQRAAGLGTLFALTAGELTAGTMGRLPRCGATLGLQSGAKQTQKQRLAILSRPTCERNMALLRTSLRRCGPRRAGSAQFATEQRLAYSLIIAIPRGTSAHCFAKRATHYSDGMSGRQASSSNSSLMWRSIDGKEVARFACQHLVVQRAEVPA